MEGKSMRKTAPRSSAGTGQWEPKDPFDVVMAYEDAATRHGALCLHDRLARQLSDDFDFRCAWWKFEHIAEPTLREQAIDDAADASMIVLSLHAGSIMSPADEEWIEAWSHRRDNRKCALVTLFAEPGAGTAATPVFTRLKQVARQARMDFFTNITATADSITGLAVDQVAAQASVVTQTMQNILHHRLPMPRWGINES